MQAPVPLKSVLLAALTLLPVGHGTPSALPCDAAGSVFALRQAPPTAPPDKSSTRPPSPTPGTDGQPAAPAEPPKIVAERDVVPEYTLARVSVIGIPPGYAVIWDVHPFGSASKATNAKLKSVLEFTAPPGQYTVQVRGVKDDDVLEAFKTITIQPRTPPGPTPPGPTPGPTPPGPTPGPQPPLPPAPIPGEGNRVLIVYETGQVHPAAQAAIFTSGVLRDYLDAKCAKDAANPTGAYRIWDRDVDLSHPSVSPSWKAAMARPRASVPWLVISNGRTGWEGPLPADVPQTLAKLKSVLGE